MELGRYAFLLLLCSMGMLVTPSARSASHDSSGVKRILVLGDSLSDGFQLRRSEAYPALLGQKLHEARLTNYQITNASQSGGTTEGGLRRLPPHLQEPVDIFILELGINDVFLDLPIDKIRENLQAIINQVRARNRLVRIMIVGVEVPNSPANDYLSAFSQMYRDLAVKNEVALVPSLLEGVAGDPALNLPDHLHPNAAGHKILARNVWQVLEPIAREASTTSAKTPATVR